MPRPKLTDETLQLELRITPPDGQPITDWKVNEDHVQLVAFLEGGSGTEKALHYHVFLEYGRSRTLLVKWIYSIAHCYNGETGNAVFFTRKPHKHTFGYIAKQGSCAVRHNVPQTTIEQWFHDSEDYLKSKETKRKQKQRTREEKVSQIKTAMIKGLQTHTINSDVNSVVDRLLAEFHNAELSLPPRSSFETLVVSIIYHVDKSFARNYYAKNLSNI